jgi:hypothetical protein
MESVVDSDERFVILLSDANIQQYGIQSERLASIIQSSKNTHVYIIFLGSIQDQAER